MCEYLTLGDIQSIAVYKGEIENKDMQSQTHTHTRSLTFSG